MNTPWMQVPTLQDWEARKATGELYDSREVGLTDAVRAGWFLNDQDELFKGFSISAEDVVVDVGCGAGGATLFCARRGAHVVYCDISAANIERLDPLLKDSPARASQGVVTDCMPLPLDSNFASRVVAMEMLEHVDDPPSVMAELVRIGQPGALYLIAVPDAASEALQKPFAPAEYFQKPNHIHIFTADQLATLVSNAGLEIVERSGYGFFWNMWMCMYWICDRSAKGTPMETSHDAVQPPYFPLLDDWAALWSKLISLPESETMRHALDQALPKSQIIIARKPLGLDHCER